VVSGTAKAVTVYPKPPPPGQEGMSACFITPQYQVFFVRRVAVDLFCCYKYMSGYVSLPIYLHFVIIFITFVFIIVFVHNMSIDKLNIAPWIIKSTT
jgi:hypothetical protein